MLGGAEAQKAREGILDNGDAETAPEPLRNIY